MANGWRDGYTPFEELIANLRSEHRYEREYVYPTQTGLERQKERLTHFLALGEAERQWLEFLLSMEGWDKESKIAALNAYSSTGRYPAAQLQQVADEVFVKVESKPQAKARQLEEARTASFAAAMALPKGQQQTAALIVHDRAFPGVKKKR